MTLELIIDNSKLTAPDSEVALLAALIHNNAVYEEIYEIIKPEYFSHDLHRQIYKKMCSILNEGGAFDVLTLKNYFEADELFKDLGGVNYLISLSQSLVSMLNCKTYAQQIKNLYLLRKKKMILEMALRKLSSQPDLDACVQLDASLESLSKLLTEGSLEEQDSSMQAIGNGCLIDFEQALKTKGISNNLMSGFHEIDNLTDGFEPGRLIIIAGRPAMGKSALALDIAYNIALAARQQRPGGGSVAFFSLEMTAKQLYARLSSQKTGLTSTQLKKGNYDPSQFEKLIEAKREIDEMPLDIFGGDYSVASLRMVARQIKRKRGLDLIIIDYLGLLQSPSDDHIKYGNRVQEISQITRDLKRLALELNIPIIALSQLSRATETREDKRPHLSDLRDSGSIEQDADIVGFVYREEYYLTREEPIISDDKWSEWRQKMNEAKNKAEFIVAKNRSGKTGIAKLHFNGSLTKFSNTV